MSLQTAMQLIGLQLIQMLVAWLLGCCGRAVLGDRDLLQPYKQVCAV